MKFSNYLEKYEIEVTKRSQSTFSYIVQFHKRWVYVMAAVYKDNS